MVQVTIIFRNSVVEKQTPWSNEGLIVTQHNTRIVKIAVVKIRSWLQRILTIPIPPLWDENHLKQITVQNLQSAKNDKTQKKHIYIYIHIYRFHIYGIFLVKSCTNCLLKTSQVFVEPPCGCFQKIGKTTKWMVCNGKPYQNGWFGRKLLFLETPTCSFFNQLLPTLTGKLWVLHSCLPKMGLGKPSSSSRILGDVG